MYSCEKSDSSMGLCFPVGGPWRGQPRTQGPPGAARTPGPRVCGPPGTCATHRA